MAVQQETTNISALVQIWRLSSMTTLIALVLALSPMVSAIATFAQILMTAQHHKTAFYLICHVRVVYLQHKPLLVMATVVKLLAAFA